MKRLVAGCAVLLALASASVRAEVQTFARAGTWSVFGGTANDGQPVCGVSQEERGRYFGFKYFYGDDTFTIQIGTKEWKIEDGAKQALQMAIDSHAAWKLTGSGMHFADGDAGLTFDVPRSDLDTFMNEWSTGKVMSITFTGSNVDSWSVDLNGIADVTTGLRDCLKIVSSH